MIVPAGSKKDRITVARLWSRYTGGVPSRAPVILGLDRQEYRTICVYLKKSCDEPNYFEAKGCQAFYISGKKFFRVFNFAAIYKLVRLFKEQKVEVLHCHKHQATVYGTIAAAIAGVPVVFAHVHGFNRSRSPRRKFINWIVLRRVKKIFTVGEAVKDDVVRSNWSVDADKVASVGNSISCERFSEVAITPEEARVRIGLEADSFVFGTVGRLAPTKGQSYLIEAFARVKQSIPNARLVFVGKGRLADELSVQAKETGFGDSIHFLGQRSDMAEVLRAMDVFVLPSVAEGLPRSLLEAMAAGLCCIASSVGGVPEILNYGEYGKLVAPKSPGELAEAMVTIHGMTREERRAFVEKSRQWVIDQYSHAVVIDRIEGIYQSEYAACVNSQGR